MYVAIQVIDGFCFPYYAHYTPHTTHTTYTHTTHHTHTPHTTHTHTPHTTGGEVAAPVNYGSATDVFCFDRTAPSGERWTVYASSPLRRHAHSSAILLPDGRTAILGGDQATYDRTTA